LTGVPTVLGPSGRFVIERELGKGRFATVFQARDRRDGRSVALKLLGEEASDGGALARFEREFHSLSHLRHENLVKLYELHFHGDERFFTMELVPGEDFVRHVRAGAPSGADPRAAASALGSPLATHGASAFAPCTPSGIQRLRAALGGLASGVAAIHRAGLVHRDLKPANVRVTPAGRVVILDYGLVTESGTGGGSEHVGTAAYMAPEQWQDEAAGPACDAYATGVMLFEALTGQLPFTGSAQAVLVRKRTVSAPRPGLLVHGVPSDLDELTAQLLEANPVRRPTVADVAEGFKS
jgi:eukaryotic-like serine/threonine-protein kinase